MIKKSIEKYKGLSKPIKMSLWFLICSFLQKGLSMITTPIFTRIMTENEFGRFSICLSWLNFFTPLVSLSIAGGFYMRGLVINNEDKNKFTSSMIGLTGTLCMGGFCIYLVFKKYINVLTEMNTYLFCIIFTQIFFTSIYSFWLNHKRTEYEYKPIVVLTVLYAVFYPILSIVMVLSSKSNFQVEGRMTATIGINILLYTGLLFSMCVKGKQFYNKEYWKQAIIFSIPLIPHYLSQIVLNQADRIMIGKYCGLAKAGYYSLAYSLAMILLTLNQAVSTSMDPWLYQKIKKNSLVEIKAVTMPILIIMAVMNLMVITVAPEVLRIFAPPEFSSAVWAIPPITASVFFMFMYTLFTAFQYYYAKTTWVMVASFVGAILNVVLNIMFIPRFGFVAAGYTTLACYVLYAIAHYYFMCRVCDEKLEGARPYSALQIGIIGLVLIIGSMVMCLLYSYVLLRYLLVLAMLIFAFVKRKRILAMFSVLKK